MILGLGIDLEENERFNDFLDNNKKLTRILSEQELEVFNTFTSTKRKKEYLTSRFCVKEAFIKATSNLNLKFNYVDLSVLNNENGQPYLQLSFPFEYKINISLSHSNNYSTAIVIIEEK